MRIVHIRKNGLPTCVKCYKRKKRKCGFCDKVDYISKLKDGKSVCRHCYEYPKKECKRCGKVRPIHQKKTQLCHSCYGIYRYENDLVYRIERLIRKRVRDVVDKTTLPKTSGFIDYGGIAEQIGPCPGDRSQYHIDHILPLFAFDLSRLSHVKAAFAPENHQWLRVEDNLVKGAKYNEDEFNEYLRRFIDNE